jgi:hypothetical protein
MANDPKYEGWERDADESAARLKQKVASFVVDVYVSSPPSEVLANEKSGVELFINDQSLGTTLLSAPLERDPGTYKIRAQMADATLDEQTIQLAAGENPHVTLHLKRTGAAAGSPVAGTTEPPAEVGKTSSRKTLGWVTVGAGGAFLIGGVVTFLMRQSALSKVKDQCPDVPSTPQVDYEDGPCPIGLKDTISQGKLMSTLSPILTGVGVVGVGVGLALVLTAPSSTTAQQGKSLTITTGLGRVDATLRF